ncbi:hypothetical protein [Nioella nitratireducens]|uniref:hypothetical protein n=1 Tax=Nioella nitratireducens TaxID=1287720 RepID=UPI0008FD6E7D|nr:hypothetical protein [Nioella nitratireducens]
MTLTAGRIALSACLAFAPLPALAQAETAQAELSCTMATICIEADPCQDWGQEIAVTETAEGDWRVVWDPTLPSDYDLVADLPAPEGSLEPTRLRSLFLSNPDTQAVQLVTLAETGNIVVTLHQPQLRPRAVTGFGRCASAVPDTEAPEVSE